MVLSIEQLPVDEVSRVCQSYRIRELSIFGSALRDDFTQDSDIDFLVEFQSDAVVGFLELAGVQEEFENILHRSVDVVSKHGLNPLIRDSILRSARIIYAS